MKFGQLIEYSKINIFLQIALFKVKASGLQLGFTIFR